MGSKLLTRVLLAGLLVEKLFVIKNFNFLRRDKNALNPLNVLFKGA